MSNSPVGRLVAMLAAARLKKKVASFMVAFGQVREGLNYVVLDSIRRKCSGDARE